MSPKVYAGGARKDCILYADGNTPPKYCCRDRRIRVGENQCVQIALVGTGPVDLLFYPSGDTDEPAIVHSTLEEGITTISDCGIFKLDYDCDAINGTEAPADSAEQMLICFKCIDKTTMSFISGQLQAICEKLLLNGDTAALAEILAQISLLCNKINSGNAVQIQVLGEIQALCAKLLESNASLESLVEQIKGLCEKLEKLIEQQATLIQNQLDHQEALLACLNVIKTNQLLTLEKMCQILGDPTQPCPECPPVDAEVAICDVKYFMTYATVDYTVTDVTIPGIDLTGKVDVPVNGNSLPALTALHEQVTACLTAAGYSLEIQQGRDGWTVAYKGPCISFTTDPADTISVECSNCSEV